MHTNNIVALIVELNSPTYVGLLSVFDDALIIYICMGDATCTLDLTIIISNCLKNKYTMGIFKIYIFYVAYMCVETRTFISLHETI